MRVGRGWQFPSFEAFEARFGDLSTKKNVEKLHGAMRPYFLRRMKADVEKSVPPKEEIVVQVELTAVQKQWYRAIYERNLTFLSSHAAPGARMIASRSSVGRQSSPKAARRAR